MATRKTVVDREYARLINRAIKRHTQYQRGMMVEPVPHDIRPDGIQVVCRIPGVMEVVADAVAEVERELRVGSQVMPSRYGKGELR